MNFDWVGLQTFMVAQLIGAVQHVAAHHPRDHIYAASVTDIYAERMLVLWPSICVSSVESLPPQHGTHDPRWDPAEWRWQFDASPEGDEWAGRVTAYAGSKGQDWDDVVAQFLDAIASACARATSALLADPPGALEDGFVIVPINGNPELIERSLDAAQLQHCFPVLSRRRTEILRLHRLPPGDRVDELVATLRDSPVHGEGFVLAAELSTEIGADAADALAVHVHAESRNPTADFGRLLGMLAVIEDIGQPTTTVTDRLVAVLSDPQVDTVLRAAAGETLAWLGRLAEIAKHLDGLPVELALNCAARPYIGDRKNGALDYGPWETVLELHPDFDGQLFGRLSPNVMFEINAADLTTAMDALSSPWRVIRRHAAIVILSTHL
ncbi:hypothetical protein ACWDUN_21475 [Mycobacterium sp. NPDC003323]